MIKNRWFMTVIGVYNSQIDALVEKLSRRALMSSNGGLSPIVLKVYDYEFFNVRIPNNPVIELAALNRFAMSVQKKLTLTSMTSELLLSGDRIWTLNFVPRRVKALTV